MGKKVWLKFQGLGVAKKLLVLSLVVSLGPILCILVINYQLSARVVQQQTGELIQANLEQNAANIENLCKGNEKILQGIYTDEFYAEKLKPINRWDTSQRYQAAYEIEERLKDICSNNQGILGVAVIGLHYDVCFYDTVTQSGQTSFCFDMEEIREKKLLEKAKEDRGVLYTSSVRKSQGEYGSYNCVYMIHQLTDFSEYQKGSVGCAILCVDEAQIQKVYSAGNTESNLTLVTDDKGDIVSSSMENWSPKKSEASQKKSEMSQKKSEASKTKSEVSSQKSEVSFQKGEASKKKSQAVEEGDVGQRVLDYVRENQVLKGNNLQVRSMEILEGQFYVVNVQDFDYAIRDFRYITVIIVLVGILTAILCMILVMRTKESVDQSVKPILSAMDRADRDEEAGWIEERDIQGYEFERISRHFNNMLKNIRDSRRMEREALIREKNAEIKALEAQINPHFLYNTLDAINWLALDRKEYTISKMLTGLASILRYSIHKSNEITKIESEMTYWKKYVHLQQQRMNYSFVCIMEVDSRLYHVKIT